MSATMISDQGPDQIFDCDQSTTTKAEGCVKIDNDIADFKPESVPSLLQKAATEAPEIVALAVKRDDKWIKWTYKEYLQGIKFF